MNEEIKNRWKELVENAATKLDEHSKKAKDAIMNEVDRLKIRAEIGQNERDISKEYLKLGEAYYNAKVNGTSVEREEESMAIISSKKRTVELLKEKLGPSDSVREDN